MVSLLILWTSFQVFRFKSYHYNLILINLRFNLDTGSCILLSRRLINMRWCICVIIALKIIISETSNWCINDYISIFSFMYVCEYSNTCLKGIFTFPSCCDCYVWVFDVVNCEKGNNGYKRTFLNKTMKRTLKNIKNTRTFLFPLALPRMMVKSWIKWSMAPSFLLPFTKFYISCTSLKMKRWNLSIQSKKNTTYINIYNKC